MILLTLEENLEFAARPFSPPLPINEAQEAMAELHWVLEESIDEGFFDKLAEKWGAAKKSSFGKDGGSALGAFAKDVAGSAASKTKEGIKNLGQSTRETAGKFREEGTKARLESFVEFIDELSSHYNKGGVGGFTWDQIKQILQKNLEGDPSEVLQKAQAWGEKILIPALDRRTAKAVDMAKTAKAFKKRISKILSL